MPPTTRSALIVGAGIAGLASALVLSRLGWRVTVVERAATLRGGAYVVGFSGIGYDTADRLGLMPALRRLESPWQPLQQVDGDGRVRATMTVAAQQAFAGPRIISILRGDLERTLDDAIDDSVERRWGQTITAVDERSDEVITTLSDGTQLSVDLLIGADGLHSTVRRLAFGPEDQYRYDFGADVVSFDLSDPPAELADRTTFLALVGRSAGIYPQRDGRLAAFFTFATDRPAGQPTGDAVAALGRVYGDLGWAWPEVIDRAKQVESVYFDSVSQIRMRTWTTRRIALLGDSAWAVSLLAGYGTSLAVGAAELLGDQLRQHTDILSALADWNRQLRPLVQRKQRQGRWSRDLLLPRNRAAVAARTAFFRLADRRLTRSIAGRFLGLDHDRPAG